VNFGEIATEIESRAQILVSIDAVKKPATSCMSCSVRSRPERRSERHRPQSDSDGLRHPPVRPQFAMARCRPRIPREIKLDHATKNGKVSNKTIITADGGVMSKTRRGSHYEQLLSPAPAKPAVRGQGSRLHQHRCQRRNRRATKVMIAKSSLPASSSSPSDNAQVRPGDASPGDRSHRPR
jgi:hypothetical protein